MPKIALLPKSAGADLISPQMSQIGLLPKSVDHFT
jgi:hypothetical protein